MKTRVKTVSSPAFKKAVRTFLKHPQTMLVRHIYAKMAEDERYATHNRRSIERVVEDVLQTQGFDPREVLAERSALQLIMEAAHRLRLTVRHA